MIRWTGSRADLFEQLKQVPNLLAAMGQRDALALSRAVGVEMLTILKEAYIEKARGGTDAAGISWKPLSPKTIAYGRRHPGLNAKRGRAAKAGRGSRPLLTKQQDSRWRGIFARLVNAGKDKSEAAAIAWSVIKSEGGKTILGTYGNASVEIGRDTGRLLNSLSPGAADNVLEARPGSVRVGTNVVYAPHFHAKRPIWPEPQADIPPAWLERLGGVVALAVQSFIERRSRGDRSW